MQSELLLYEKQLEHQTTQKNSTGFNHNAIVNMANTRGPQNNGANQNGQKPGNGGNHNSNGAHRGGGNFRGLEEAKVINLHARYVEK